MGAHPHGADAAGTRKRIDLAEVMHAHGAAFRAVHTLSGVQHRALRAIEACRTAALGGEIAQCSHCGATHYRYHSCRNRHCPKCQSLARERWLAARRGELLPVPYFHLVFTLPHELNALAQGNPRAIYGLLFATAAHTLIDFGRNPRWLGGEIAATLLLHTWSQTLTQHLHLHALVAGGALGPEGQWLRPCAGFLFPVKALSRVYRAKFLDGLAKLFLGGRLRLAGSTSALAAPSEQQRLLAALRAKHWVVYAKPTLQGTEPVLDYLGRYTHRIAISNERLLYADADTVRLRYRDRAHGNRRKVLSLAPREFLRRFLLHVLPRGFMRIRHYGLLANRAKRERLAQARLALDAPAPEPVLTESVAVFCLRVMHRDISQCPVCHIGQLRVIATMPVPMQRARPPLTAQMLGSSYQLLTQHRALRGPPSLRPTPLTLHGASAIVTGIALATGLPRDAELDLRRDRPQTPPGTARSARAPYIPQNAGP